MSSLRFFHDGEWYEVSGALGIPGFRASVATLDPPVIFPNDSEVIVWNAWEWVNTPEDDVFEPIVIGGPEPTFTSLRVRESGLYMISCRVRYSEFEDELHVTAMSDGYAFKSLVYGRNNANPAPAGIPIHTATWIRRFPSQGEDFVSPGIFALLLFEAGSTSGTTTELDTQGTELEVWKLTP